MRNRCIMVKLRSNCYFTKRGKEEICLDWIQSSYNLGSSHVKFRPNAYTHEVNQFFKKLNLGRLIFERVRVLRKVLVRKASILECGSNNIEDESKRRLG